jgi:hypothetical protein
VVLLEVLGLQAVELLDWGLLEFVLRESPRAQGARLSANRVRRPMYRELVLLYRVEPVPVVQVPAAPFRRVEPELGPERQRVRESHSLQEPVLELLPQ